MCLLRKKFLKYIYWGKTKKVKRLVQSLPAKRQKSKKKLHITTTTSEHLKFTWKANVWIVCCLFFIAAELLSIKFSNFFLDAIFLFSISSVVWQIVLGGNCPPVFRGVFSPSYLHYSNFVLFIFSLSTGSGFLVKACRHSSADYGSLHLHSRPKVHSYPQRKLGRLGLGDKGHVHTWPR